MLDLLNCITGSDAEWHSCRSRRIADRNCECCADRRRQSYSVYKVMMLGRMSQSVSSLSSAARSSCRTQSLRGRVSDYTRPAHCVR